MTSSIKIRWGRALLGGFLAVAHPRSLDRAAVERLVSNWPGDSRDAPSLRRTMSTYAVSLGVGCQFCHVPGTWNAETPMLIRTRPMIALMDEFLKYFEFASAAAFTCYTCHQGAVRIPAGLAAR